MTLLDIVILLPLVGFLVTLLIPRSNPSLVRTFAAAMALITFVVSLGLIAGFNSDGVNGNAGGLQFETNFVWIENPQIHYHVGIDGISLWLILLSTFLTPIAVLLSWRAVQQRPKEFYAFLLLLEFGLVGVFAAFDLFLFYVFWEVCLVPMYFLIGIWGHDRRIYAAVKFFLYTMAGSVLMLVAIIYLYLRVGGGSFDYATILGAIQSGRTPLTGTEELWLFLAFFFAFAIKVPLFPLHTWLPDAHVEAPTAGSVMLASVMLKMGTYGLVRFCVPLFPNAARTCSSWIIPLAITGIVYGALVAMVQPNMKKLVAYSSVSHLGFVVLGVFSFTQLGMDGAVYQMLNHGISTGALFLLVGFMYERRHSLAIVDYGGVATVAPWLSTVFLITTLASIGLPTLNNFIGEFLVLQGSAQVNIIWTVFASLGVILSACYMLWLYQRIFFGKASEEVEHHMPDLSGREWACIVPLIIMMVWMGTYTQSFLTPVTKATARLLGETRTPRSRCAETVPPPAACMLSHREESPGMPTNWMPTSAEYFRFLPEIILTIAGTLLMVMDAISERRGSPLYGNITIAALIAAAIASVTAFSDPGPAFSQMLMVDAFATFFRILVIGVGILAVLASYRYLDRENAEPGEYHALILFSVMGQCVMVTANELIMIFIGLEISSIATYVLAGYLRDDKRNNEAALKYFLLGSFATAFFLYGVALIYGMTGSTNLSTIRGVVTGVSPSIIAVSAALMLVGLLFKVSGAPFQVWAPDVYQGAPVPVSAFMSAGPKAAAFAILLRIFMTAFPSIGGGWAPLVWVSALLSMTIGNFGALTQSNVKRMLAYSSIAHAGYVLVAVTSQSDMGTAAAMFYLAAYAMMNVGAFAVVTHLSGKGEKHVSVDDFAGLATRQPVTAGLLTVFLLSLIGVPLTAGFFGKFYIFQAALQSHLVWLAILGLLNSAVAAYYYLWILVVMYMKEPGETTLNLEPLGVGLSAALLLPAAGTFVLGVFPGLILNFAGKSAMFAR